MRAMGRTLRPTPLPLLALALAGCPGPAATEDAGRPTDAAHDAFRPDSGAPPPRVDLVADLADPFAPARLRGGTPFLVSSRQPEPPEGMLNRDYGYFVREEDGRGVMIDREGPGVITRWWMTIGDLPGPRDPEAVRIRLWIDGVEVDPDGGDPGMTLETLTNGSTPGLAAPFTLGREGTSGGFVVSQPIHYQRSIRADVTIVPGWTYYQLEGYDLDPGTVVPSFQVLPRPEDEGSLEAAALLWRDHEHPGMERQGDPGPLAPGGTTELAWMGPGVATELVLEVPRAARETITAVLEVDGEEVLRAPLAWVVGGDDPAAEAHASALFAVDPAAVRLYYPIPFALSLVVRLENAGSAALDRARLAGRVVSMPLDDDLGRFRALCRAGEAIPSIQMCGTMDPAQRAANHVIASVSGTRGHYVGHSLVQRVPSDWWCALETDHEVFLDGAYTLLGTGLEDYYSAGFYWMFGPISWTLAGASGWTRSTVDGSGATHLFRHHLVDTIPFQDELRFEYESYVNGTTFTGCAYFYVAPE
jgi:hypothetical protein